MASNNRNDQRPPSLDGAEDRPIWSGKSIADAESPRHRRRGRRILLGSIVTLVVLVATFGGILYSVTNDLANNVHRLPHVFAPLNQAQRPTTPAIAAHSMTVLLVGLDTRSQGGTTGSGASASSFVAGSNSDVMMVVRLNADRTSATLVSIPRDSWVPIPGYGKGKINSSYAIGGPTLAVRTVEDLTHIRIDHFATIDFDGFKTMTTAVGGVDVRVAAQTSSGGATFHAGIDHLSGNQALAYVRQRHGLPRSDLDRVQRQQNVLRALMNKAVSGGLLSSPGRTYHLLSAVTKSVSIDDTMSNGALRSLAFGLRDMRPSHVTFMTAPVSGFGTEGSQDVVYLNPQRAPLLWRAVNDNKVPAYLAKYGGDTLPNNPR